MIVSCYISLCYWADSFSVHIVSQWFLLLEKVTFLNVPLSCVWMGYISDELDINRTAFDCLCKKMLRCIASQTSPSWACSETAFELWSGSRPAALLCASVWAASHRANATAWICLKSDQWRDASAPRFFITAFISWRLLALAQMFSDRIWGISLGFTAELGLVSQPTTFCACSCFLLLLLN